MSNAIVITEFGGPEVLQWREVEPPAPQQGEVLIRVKAAGVGPTDLHIRAGHLAAVFPQRPGDVLGFEAAGVIEAVGEEADAALVTRLLRCCSHKVGTGNSSPPPCGTQSPRRSPGKLQPLCQLLPRPQSEPSPKPRRDRTDARGPRCCRLRRIDHRPTRSTRGIRVIGVADDRDADLWRIWGRVRSLRGSIFGRISPAIDAVIDAAGRGDLVEAVAATGDPTRVVTLTGGPELVWSGALMSMPGPDRAPDALAIMMPLLADGSLRLKGRRTLPVQQAAEAHRLLESGETHDKIVLTFES